MQCFKDRETDTVLKSTAVQSRKQTDLDGMSKDLEFRINLYWPITSIATLICLVKVPGFDT